MRVHRPRVVIVGAGFGGLSAARALRGAKVDVLLLDRHNYHLFQPLLYQVAVAGLTAGEIAYPIRAILRRQRNAEFRLAEVLGFELDARRVLTATGPVDYDYLIVAAGARSWHFDVPGIERHALPLKGLDDAIAIRNRVLSGFEAALATPDASLRRDLLTLIVAGGGPTGVEMAGALSELVRLFLRRDYPSLDLSEVRIVLLEASDRLLSGMPADLAERARRDLESLGVEVRTGTSVQSYDGETVTVRGGAALRARTLIWAAGVRAVPLAGSLGLPVRASGRVAVEPTLQVAGRPEVFVIGDAAYLEHEGQALPLVAPPAIQMGATAARNIRRMLDGAPLEAFRFRDPGSLATIGRRRAVAVIHGFRFRGTLAWLVWLFVHLMQLVGHRNRAVVFVNWAWEYFTYERAEPLILRD